MPRPTPRFILAATACLAALASCSSSAAPKPTAAPISTTTTTTAPAAQWYVSLGDSYAAGYQPTGPNGGVTTRDGFAYQVVGLAAAKGVALQLANFGCGGATTSSILHDNGCDQLGPGGIAYPTTPQATAAEQFIADHKGHIGLITVSISGNDVTHCALESNPVPCVTAALAQAEPNLSTLLSGLRNAAGPGVAIIGTTYPDIFLSLWVSGRAGGQDLAKLSVTALQALINPTLKRHYEAVGGSLVDVTAATGAYTPLTETTQLAPYGTVPSLSG